jgi:hypothetical protein
MRQPAYSVSRSVSGFGYSPKEANAPGALGADVTVSPEDIAFAGAHYLNGLL